MNTVKTLLSSRCCEVWSVSPDVPVYEALEIMEDKNVGALVVLEADKLVGMISERDYARKVVLRGKSSRTTPVREIMSSPVVVTKPDQTVEECMALMSRYKIRHLPVVDGDKILGVISTTDVVNHIISQQEQTIRFYQDLSLDR